MFVAVFLLLFFEGTYGNAVYKCSDSNETSVSFNKSVDNVDWRYTTTFCAPWKPNLTEWKMSLSYWNNPALCDNPRKAKKKPPSSHSILKLDTDTLPRNVDNCSNVCYSVNFDMIFNACYMITNLFTIGKKSSQPSITMHKVNDSMSLDYIMSIMPTVDESHTDTHVLIKWHNGIPTTNYTVDLSKTQDDKPGKELLDVTQNCSLVSLESVLCEFALGSSYGLYDVMFTREAPWVSGGSPFETTYHYYFNHTGAAPERAGGAAGAGAGGALWWAGGAALLATVLLGGVVLQRALGARHLHKQILHSWRRAREQECTEPSGTTPDSRPILLLYAREDETGQRVVDALKTVLQLATEGEVLDIFSPEAMSACAAAPGAWLRGLLGAAHVRVVLLQSPAAAALYDTKFDEADLSLRAPLLNARVCYRAPHFGDGLVALALRLMAEQSHVQNAYHKYYIAYYSSLEGAELSALAGVAPHRRYALPHAAAALAHHLRAAPRRPAPPRLAPALAQLARAAAQFQQHVHAHPDYLLHHLTVL